MKHKLPIVLALELHRSVYPDFSFRKDNGHE